MRRTVQLCVQLQQFAAKRHISNSLKVKLVPSGSSSTSKLIRCDTSNHNESSLFATTSVLKSTPLCRRGASTSFSLSKELKKFYKNAHITQASGNPGYYEVNLDQRKLKTPMGHIFQVPGEALALAVAAEWNSQREKIKRYTMHITSLCNTAIDNPMQKTRSQMVRKISHYLGSDTLCFRMDEPEKLVLFQKEHWDPILTWFKKRFDVELEPTVGILSPEVPAETYGSIEKQLMSYSDWSLVGLEQVVDCLKSLSLALALIESEIEVPKAVFLSRLEQVYQVDQWGSVEWYHDVEVMETQARVAAATLFVHLCHDFMFTQAKQKTSFADLNM